MKPSLFTKPVSGLIAGLTESLTRLFGAAPREKFDETILAKLDLAEPFHRKKIVVSIMGDRNPFEPEELERVRKLIAEIAEENVKLEAACEPAIKAAYRLDPGGLDSPTLQARYEKAAEVRRAIKRGMRERSKEIADILRCGLTQVADKVENSALDLAEAEGAAANHFGLAYTPSSLVRAMATTSRWVRSTAENEWTSAPDIEGMTCGLVQK